MKKIIVLYVLTIIFIALIAFLMGTPFEMFSFIHFPKWMHIALEGTNSLLMFLIFLVSNHMFSKTKNERLLIVACGFLIAATFNTVHIITVNDFPYDYLSLANLDNDPAMGYLFICNLILPLSIYIALLHRPSEQKPEVFKLNIYGIYFLIFLILCLTPYLINHLIPKFGHELDIIAHSLEFINYSLYIMLAFIVINIRHGSNTTFFPTFTLGLIISGLAGLFYLSVSYVQLNEILAHILQGLGLIFILIGMKKFLVYSLHLRFKDELVAYLCLLLIAFYIGFISIVSELFHVALPPVSAYVFLEFILIFQFCVYLISNKVTQPITKIIDALDEYTPGQEYTPIPVARNDEFGVLTNKINEISLLSLQKIQEVAKVAEREHSLVRIFESMRRVSNQDIIKNSIIEEVKNLINPDEIFIALYNKDEDCFYLDKYIEKLPSKIVYESEVEKKEEIMVTQLNEFLKTSLEICFSNIDKYIETNSLMGTKKEKIFREYNIKSCCNVPIYYSGQLLGCLVIQYTKDFVELDKLDITYLKTMAVQLGIVIHNQQG